MRISDWSSDVCSSDLWIAHERELEQLLVDLVRNHFLCGDRAAVARQLGGDPMAGQVVESMARPLKVVERVTPQQTLERCAHAGAAGLGDVHEQKLIAVGEQHPVFS